MSTKLKVTPYPYQQEGINYGIAHPRLIIGDEPGLGKTLQSIGLAHSTIDCTIYSLINKKKSVAAEIMNSDDDIPKDTAYFDQLADTFLDSFIPLDEAVRRKSADKTS